MGMEGLEVGEREAVAEAEGVGGVVGDKREEGVREAVPEVEGEGGALPLAAPEAEGEGVALALALALVLTGALPLGQAEALGLGLAPGLREALGQGVALPLPWALRLLERVAGAEKEAAVVREGRGGPVVVGDVVEEGETGGEGVIRAVGVTVREALGEREGERVPVVVGEVEGETPAVGVGSPVSEGWGVWDTEGVCESVGALLALPMPPLPEAGGLVEGVALVKALGLLEALEARVRLLQAVSECTPLGLPVPLGG